MKQTPIPIAAARRMAEAPNRFGPPVQVREVAPGWGILEEAPAQPREYCPSCNGLIDDMEPGCMCWMADRG